MTSTPSRLRTDAPLADGQWHRAHWSTPLMKSWQALAVLIVFVGQDAGQSAMRGEGSWWNDLRSGDLGRASGSFLAGGLGLLVLLLAAGVGLAVLSWRMTRFRVTEDAVELHSGVLNRQQRRARIDRMQAVDVVQPLLGRIVGLAKLKLEVAGGIGSSVELAFLREEEAQRLRDTLLARAAGVTWEADQAPPTAPEQLVLEVPQNRLIGSIALSGIGVLVVGFVVAVSVSAAVLGSAEPLFALGPAMLGVVGAIWNRFVGGFGFTVAASPDGLRLRHGLLEHRAQTVPPGRVQAVEVCQPLLWRRPGWWRIRVNVAGYGAGTSQITENVLLPVGTLREAMDVLALVLPDLGVEDGEQPVAVASAAMVGSGDAAGFVPSPRAARWLDPVSWRRRGFRVTRHALLLRSGRLRRHLVLVPHARTQSCGLSQGPLQRRLDLVSFTLHSTAGPVSPVLHHLDAAVGARLLAEQSERARTARAAAGPERWMEQLREHPEQVAEELRAVESELAAQGLGAGAADADPVAGAQS